MNLQYLTHLKPKENFEQIIIMNKLLRNPANNLRNYTLFVVRQNAHPHGPICI